MAVLEGKKGQLRNHATYKVTGVCEIPGTVTLQDDEGEFPVSVTDAAKYLRQTTALTMASIEGCTLQGPVRIHDGNHPRMDWRKLNVCMSRATAAELLEIV